MGGSVKAWLSEISVRVYVLIMLFAMSGWIDINAVYTELPLMVYELPEGWALASYITIIIQAANIAPILYIVLGKCSERPLKEWPFIYAIILVSLLASLVLAFCWRATAYVASTEASLAVFLLVVILAMADTLSTVIFLPYMSAYRPQYMTAFFVGGELSNLLPGLAGLIQGTESEPLCTNVTIHIYNQTLDRNYTRVTSRPVYSEPVFSVQGFYLLITAMIAVSFVSFNLIQFSTFGRNARLTASYDLRDTNSSARDESMRKDSDACQVINMSRRKSIVALPTGLVISDRPASPVTGSEVRPASPKRKFVPPPLIIENGVSDATRKMSNASVGTPPPYTPPVPNPRSAGQRRMSVILGVTNLGYMGEREYFNNSLPESPIRDIAITLEGRRSVCSDSDVISSVADSEFNADVTSESSSGSRGRYVVLLVLTAWVNGLDNGVLHSIQAYACLPYGSLAYSLSIRLASISSALVCFASLFIPVFSFLSVLLLALLGTLFTGYQLFLSAMSPNPPLKGEDLGTAIVVSDWRIGGSCVFFIADIVTFISLLSSDQMILFDTYKRGICT